MGARGARTWVPARLGAGADVGPAPSAAGAPGAGDELGPQGPAAGAEHHGSQGKLSPGRAGPAGSGVSAAEPSARLLSDLRGPGAVAGRRRGARGLRDGAGGGGGQAPGGSAGAASLCPFLSLEQEKVAEVKFSQACFCH